ncbi:RNA ligase [Nonomuraea wenchangensis]|uniref:RNA ligase n=1 Tax=Nonomuraea wenchangensis TaxID=568860 RepID=A0A1I0F4P8_9ACTN|nr:RNA ligase [Nonomuraea wenchangensis]SET52023.1 RNA ligase [Nonomuraea wenchangensis]
MTHIWDLFDLEYLEKCIEAGYVRVQEHPTEPLEIYNYTEKTQYEGVWDVVTRTCRGLIVDEQGAIVARPFAKFFNYGDPLAGDLDLSAPAEVIDKMDGSLGILHPTSAGYAVATRGSFTSMQAAHATAVFRARYGDFEPPPGMTVLFEVVYPENRIVCDYGGADDLFLLGAVDIATGAVVGPDWVSGWDGPQATVFSVRTLGEALAMPPRPGAEGLVVRMLDSGHMVKLKQADYVALHKVITGLNARGVWELLGAGKSVADICEPLPDEFHQWVKDLAGRLTQEADDLLYDTEQFHDKILGRLPEGWTRKDYALEAAKSTLRPWLFNLLDGKDPRPAIWRTLRPSGDMRPVTFSEDAA